MRTRTRRLLVVLVIPALTVVTGILTNVVSAESTSLFPGNSQRWNTRKGRSAAGARLASVFAALPEPARLVVLGEAGSGKTELLVGAFQSLLDSSENNRRPVPVLIPMTAWRPAAALAGKSCSSK